MVRNAQGAAASLDRVRVAIAEGIRARRKDVEQTALVRVYALSDPGEAADPEYAEGLRAAVSAALDYGLAALERGEERSPPIPAALLAQARLAARNGVNLDTVLRRYFSGYVLLSDFLIHTAEEVGVHGATLQLLTREQAVLFDRLVEVVTAEFVGESEGLGRTSEKRRAERIQKLLDGELLGTAEFEYEFEGHHLGLIVAGPEGPNSIRALATAVDRRHLSVCRGDGIVWAWLGGRRPIDVTEIERLASMSAGRGLSLAIGEPGHGFSGWRATHNQAKAAWPVALRSAAEFTRYRDVALLASIRNDELLANSLRELYLIPLESDRDSGETMRRTLRAYFAASRNVSSAAASLGVSRRTVSSRLRAIEERIGYSLATVGADVEAALHLQNLHDMPVRPVEDPAGLPGRHRSASPTKRNM